jgi:rubredoxin
MAKAARRARKKERKALKVPKHRPLHCDGCGRHVLDNNHGNHDSALSANGHTWDGLAVAAWCPYCGSDHCS